jgi:hypothetical protein
MDGTQRIARTRLAAETSTVWLVTTALYALTLARNLSIAHDSIDYLLNIEQHLLSFHPHHLLYHWTALTWLTFWSPLLGHVDHMLVVEMLNAVLGGVVIALFYAVLRQRLGLTPFSASLGTTLPAFSFGLWFYSTAVEVYIIPIAFLMLTFYILSARELTLRSFLAAGGTHGLAILFHQSYLLFGVAVLCAAFLPRANHRPPAWRALAAYTAVVAPVVVIPYLVVILGVMHIPSLTGAIAWMTLYAHHGGYWTPPGLAMGMKAAIGLGRSFIGGHFLFASPHLQALIKRLLPDHWMMDEAYLVRTMSTWQVYLLLLIVLTIGVFVAVLTISRWRSASEALRRHRAVTVLALGWLGAFTAFFLFWDPANLEFWIPQSVCLWLLALTIWSRHHESVGYERLPLVPIALLSVGLFTVNMAGSIRWMVDPHNDYYHRKVEPLISATGPDDLIIIGRTWLYESYVRRCCSGTIVPLIDMKQQHKIEYREALATIRGHIETTLRRGGRVFISDDAVHLESETLRWIRAPADESTTFWGPYRPRWKRIANDVGIYYVVEP